MITKVDRRNIQDIFRKARKQRSDHCLVAPMSGRKNESSCLPRDRCPVSVNNISSAFDTGKDVRFNLLDIANLQPVAYPERASDQSRHDTGSINASAIERDAVREPEQRYKRPAK